ncbi:MAG: hypothetical protein R3215_15645 [Halomonas sp.]|nr:hypothetical protein [Halomonas sp.]
MERLKATPAPWQSAGDSADWWLGTDAGPIITASYQGCVEVENPADMPLIKAAPKLYAALEDALSELETMRYARYEALEAKCRSALAEARGEA